VRSVSLATQVLVVIGALLLAAAVILGMLGSFAYLALAATGLFFVTAALISHAARSPDARVPALLALLGVMLSLLGTVTRSPSLYAGVGLIVGAAAIALLLAGRTRSTPT
jgi:hypothetical protein